MLESQLQILLRSVLLAGLNVRGINAEVKAAAQPTQQGTPTNPVIFAVRIGGKRYGSPTRKNYIDPTTQALMYSETETFESTYQISGLVRVDPSADPATPNTLDLVKIAGDILQSQTALDTFAASDVGVLRITDISTSFFDDDRDQFEENPTFRVTLRHSNVFAAPANTIDSINGGIFPI